MKMSQDKNGNKILVVESKDLTPKYAKAKIRGFSVQTLGNLPETHRHGIHYDTKPELFQFIDKHGTERQREALSCDTETHISEIIDGTYYGSHKPVFRAITETDLDGLVDLLGGRKKAHLRNALKYNIESMPYANRLSYLPSQKRWTYCAGQDYPAELARIRKEILN